MPGFCVLSGFAEIECLTTGIYKKATESGIRWNDPTVGIDWPVTEWLARSEAANFRYGHYRAGSVAS
jgi:dTDP-4-dehydrorhamnose 3,5-epimerase-like enzyme